ncbi:MAG: 7TM diverse intracellular signaling domain-containing protein [Cytophagales bacterium]|nr:7TM diverse intracellular signaling domain-containing protein [Cytophagales bacterium]
MRILVLLFIIFSIKIYADKIPFFLEPKIYDVNDHREHYYYIDSTDKLTIDDIKTSYYQSKLIRIPYHHSAPIYKNKTYWLKFIITEDIDEDIFSKISPYYDHIVLYSSAGQIHKPLGFNMPFCNRSINSNDLVLKIGKLKRGDVFYLKQKLSSFNYGIGIELHTATQLINLYIYEYLSYGLFFGICIIVCFYNLFIFFTSLERVYLYYSIYILNLMAFASVDWCFIVRYFDWGQLPFNTLYYTIPYNLMTIFIVMYIKSFLMLKIYDPRLNTLLNACIIYKTTVFIISLFWTSEWFVSQVHDAIVLTITYSTVIYLALRRYKPSYILCFGCTLLIMAYWIHSNDELIKMSAFSDIISKIGERSLFYDFIISETVVFAFALAIRYRLLKTEKENVLSETIRLKENANKELEYQLNERTKLIEQQTIELKSMNEKLKNQNIILESEIKDKTEAIIHHKTLNFDEFKKIFPNQTSCFVYLTDIKWKNGFECKKCNNTKYSFMEDNITRRCSKCRTVHSATSDTIFHKLKFPIDKAFYILFLSTSGKKYTLEQISEMINLRKETCWAFRKKIEEVMTQKKYQKNVDIVWSDLIL